MHIFYLLLAVMMLVVILAIMLLTTAEAESCKPKKLVWRRTQISFRSIPVWRGQKSGHEAGSDDR